MPVRESVAENRTLESIANSPSSQGRDPPLWGSLHRLVLALFLLALCSLTSFTDVLPSATMAHPASNWEQKWTRIRASGALDPQYLACLPFPASQTSYSRGHEALHCWFSGKESTYRGRRAGLILGSKILRRRKRQPTQLFLPGKSHGQRNRVGYWPWGHKESDTTENAHT